MCVLFCSRDFRTCNNVQWALVYRLEDVLAWLWWTALAKFDDKVWWSHIFGCAHFSIWQWSSSPGRIRCTHSLAMVGLSLGSYILFPLVINTSGQFHNLLFHVLNFCASCWWIGSGSSWKSCMDLLGDSTCIVSLLWFSGRHDVQILVSVCHTMLLLLSLLSSLTLPGFFSLSVTFFLPLSTTPCPFCKCCWQLFSMFLFQGGWVQTNCNSHLKKTRVAHLPILL